MVVPAGEAVANVLLRQAREVRNQTQDEVADGLIQLGAGGVTGNLVSKWERGICRPSRFHRRLLCQFFEATPEQLGFGGTSSGGPPEEIIRARTRWSKCQAVLAGVVRHGGHSRG